MLNLRVHPPLYLLTWTRPCWKCQQPYAVFGFATAHVDVIDDEEGDEVVDFAISVLEYLYGVPDAVLHFIRGRDASYGQRMTRRYQDEGSFGNKCPCGALHGHQEMFSPQP